MISKIRTRIFNLSAGRPTFFEPTLKFALGRCGFANQCRRPAWEFDILETTAEHLQLWYINLQENMLTVDFFKFLIIGIYLIAAAGLVTYGLNCYVMIFLFSKHQKTAATRRDEVRRQNSSTENLPLVTTQVPIFNEYNVAERVMRAVCAMTYPPGRHEIQILDDSNDETSELVDQTAVQLKLQGHDITVIRRQVREGFKAGALAEGLKKAKGEFIAIFDADFVPPHDFLLQSISFFRDTQIGLVQARWGHLNPKKSMLTRAQSIGIDGHFMVEQAARNWSGLFMNFNGTAGIWRKQAIIDGGGWQWDTLTEDMDLSYRVQFAGWKTIFLPDVIIPAEIPDNICAFKNQQYRWAKGSIQTAVKLLPTIFRAPISRVKKLQAFFHLTHYMVHPLMILLAVLALPFHYSLDKNLGIANYYGVLGLILVAMAAPNLLYLLSQKLTYENWGKRILYLPFLVIFGTGIAVSNAKAVIEALIGHKSEFVRTPKKGDRSQIQYRVRSNWTAIFEIGLGSYCATALVFCLLSQNHFIIPFLLIFSLGFLYVGFLTLLQVSGLIR